ncbi:MAG: YbaY family lipoprotein [Caulobacter sp.]
MKAALSLALPLALLALAGCASTTAPPGAAAVTGTVVWRERIMLPPTTKVIVRLQDVSLADAPAKVMAEDVIEGVRAPPAAFKLAYDPAQIVPNHRYSVSARVEVDGRLRFVSDTHVAVINDGPTSGVEVLVKGVAP